MLGLQGHGLGADGGTMRVDVAELVVNRLFVNESAPVVGVGPVGGVVSFR
jgi:hypothetical protein